MKIDPGFATHWKTERLIEQLGADGIVVLLRIWGQAQIRREWQGLKWTPKRLAMETKWKADENHLWRVLTDPDAPWLDVAEDGTVSIHDFEEHQKQVIHLWSAGGKGGRPKKVSPTPSSKNEENTSPSSSSYPIGFSNENQMVFCDGEKSPRNPKRYATHEEVTKYATSQPMPISEDCIDSFFDRMEEIGWTDDKGLPLADWRARFRRYATNWANNRTNPKATR
jgi:hypothetical protein